MVFWWLKTPQKVCMNIQYGHSFTGVIQPTESVNQPFFCKVNLMYVESYLKIISSTLLFKCYKLCPALICRREHSSALPHILPLFFLQILDDESEEGVLLVMRAIRVISASAFSRVLAP